MCSAVVGVSFYFLFFFWRVGERGAVTACQHSESAAINHHTFDQNAANLYSFL